MVGSRSARGIGSTIQNGSELKNNGDLSSIAFTSQRDKSLSIDRKSDKASRGSKMQTDKVEKLQKIIEKKFAKIQSKTFKIPSRDA